MQNIFSTSGLLAQAPAPSVAIITTITARAAAKKAQQNPAHQYKSHSHHITLYT